MTTIEQCPVCHLNHSMHRPCQTPIRTWVGSPHSPTPIPTERSILLAQLADLKRTVADDRNLIDAQAKMILRLDELLERALK